MTARKNRNSALQSVSYQIEYFVCGQAKEKTMQTLELFQQHISKHVGPIHPGPAEEMARQASMVEVQHRREAFAYLTERILASGGYAGVLDVMGEALT